jgi:hypothetical protein
MEHPTCHLTVRVKEIPEREGERRLGKFGLFLFLCVSPCIVLMTGFQ